MKSRFFVFLLIGTLALRAQNVAPAPTAAASSTTSASAGTDAATASAAPVYPGTRETIEATTKAGILGLRATDIPRYTQTGPIPNPAPARLGVIAPFPRDPKLPTIWTIGDSTVRTGVNGAGDDKVGQWGWGAPFVGYFDPKKVNVANRAMGGTTSRSFYLAQWKAMVDLIKKGDVVIMQFGTNSGGGELKGVGDDTQAAMDRSGQPALDRDGKPVLNHTFGWYIRQFIAETRAKGATPIVCSLIPRNSRDASGKIARSATTQAGWAKQTAAAEGAGFIDLNELVARKYDAMDKDAVDQLYAGSPHTSWAGAVLNAETVISGLKALKDDPVAAYYVDQVKQIAPAPDLTASTTEPATTDATPATPAASTPASPTTK
jgi:lysophospholipase L1-like esterase